MRHLFVAIGLGAFAAAIASAQTTTTYEFPSGMVCASGVENCYYEIANGAQSGVFEAGGYWTQFDYRAYPGQNPGYNAAYCNGTQVWTSAATPALGPTAYYYTMTCNATDLHGVKSTFNVEINTHSFVATYTCGTKVRTTCHQTRWMIDSGSISITQ